jgi:four helix bundle protein
MQDFHKIKAWHVAQRLIAELFHACGSNFSRYPGLRSQTLRTANSIASNISEGAAKSPKDFARYLDMSHGATNELENHLTVALTTGLLSSAIFEHLIDLVDLERRMLIKLASAVRRGFDQGNQPGRA